MPTPPQPRSGIGQLPAVFITLVSALEFGVFEALSPDRLAYCCGPETREIRPPGLSTFAEVVIFFGLTSYFLFSHEARSCFGGFFLTS
jgi:hypothetical protein